LTSITCSDGSDPSNITLSPGEIVTVTVTNTQKAKIRINKVTDPVDAGPAFPIVTSWDGTQNIHDTSLTYEYESGWLLPGSGFSASETPPDGWTLTSITCSDGSDPSNITLSPGEIVTVTVNNTKLGKIIVVKNARGGNGTFYFSGVGDGLPASFNILTLGSPNGTGSVMFENLLPGAAGGSRSITEVFGLLPPGWIFTGVGVTSALGTSTYLPLLGSDTDPTAVVSNLGAGDTVTITYDNTAPLVTRTQGFWATHLHLTDAVWFGGTIGEHTFAGIADKTIGTHVIDSPCKLMAAFWSNMAKKSTGAKRSAADQARMQLLQQLVAAILNNEAFGSSPATGMSIGDAENWFANPNATAKQLRDAASAMAAFNESGDSGIFTPGISANGKLAKDTAAPCLVFWDSLP
jgi:hypothetical protein